jgi:glycosyltransferase involved in cell wall biosynthesis
MKDHPNFLRAAARVAGSRNEVRFICIGSGPASYREALLAEARALGLERRMIWTGSRDDMPKVYNALDIVVSSSAFGEGFPNTIVEAMATGVPCVVTDVGDSAAIVGELGWVCPPRDSAALAGAIVRAIEALPCDADRIRQHVSAKYHSTILLERTMAQLAPLAGGPPVIAGAFRWRHK